MTTAAARNGALMTVASMMSVQLGAALAVKLMDGVGPAGVAWLRLAWAGVLMLLGAGAILYTGAPGLAAG